MRRRSPRPPAQSFARRPAATGLASGRRAEGKKAAHALVHQLFAQGHSRRTIAPHPGLSLNTVLRYASAARGQDTIRENRPRPSRLDAYERHPERCFAAGCNSVTHLHGELVADNAPVNQRSSHVAWDGSPATSTASWCNR